MKYAEIPIPKMSDKCSNCNSKRKMVIKYTKKNYPNRSVVVKRCCDCGMLTYFTSCVEENMSTITVSPYTAEAQCCNRNCNQLQCEYNIKRYQGPTGPAHPQKPVNFDDQRFYATTELPDNPQMVEYSNLYLDESMRGVNKTSF